MTAQSEAEKPFPKSGASFNPIQLPALGRGWAGPTHKTADDTDAGRGRPKMVLPFLHIVSTIAFSQTAAWPVILKWPMHLHNHGVYRSKPSAKGPVL